MPGMHQLKWLVFWSFRLTYKECEEYKKKSFTIKLVNETKNLLKNRTLFVDVPLCNDDVCYSFQLMSSWNF